MMKKLLIAILLLPLFCNSQWYIGRYIPGVNSDTITWTGKTVVFIGDSYFAGNFDGGTQTIPAGFGDLTGCIVDNNGISGSVLQNGLILPCASHSVFPFAGTPTYDNSYAAIFVALGTNDVGSNNGTMTPAAYQAALMDSIEYLHTVKLWPYKRIIVVTPYYTQQTGRDIDLGQCGVSVAADYTRLRAYRTSAISATTFMGTQICDMQQMQIDTGNPDALMAPDGLHPSLFDGAQFIIQRMRLRYYL